LPIVINNSSPAVHVVRSARYRTTKGTKDTKSGADTQGARKDVRPRRHDGARRTDDSRHAAHTLPPFRCEMRGRKDPRSGLIATREGRHSGVPLP